jgi:hypothetical protein
MRRRLWLVLPALSILCLGLAWHYGPAIIRHLVFSRPTVQHTQQADEGDVAALQARVTDALSSLGLEERHRTALHAEEQQDERGPWSVRHESWSLPSGDDPMALGRRIEALVASSDPRAEIYVVHHETHRVQVRLYAGSRLAQVISLETKLEPWPRLGRGAAPMLALVVHGVDDDPHGIRQLMEQESPIGLALSPYSPFTLRLSRDALHTNVEVLVAAADDVALPESLAAVPHASGLVVHTVPAGEPEAQAQALAAAGVYIIDAVEEGMGAAWLRALQDAGVPYQRGYAPQSELDRHRYRHAAAREGAAIVVVPARQGEIEVAQLSSARERGFRLAFPAEVVEAERD